MIELEASGELNVGIERIQYKKPECIMICHDIMI